MKKSLQVLGTLLIIAGILFLFVHSFVVTGTAREDFARDLFGFPIPHPPVWTSYIPFLGSFLGFIFEYFSIHGLIGISVAGILWYVGGLLITKGESKRA